MASSSDQNGQNGQESIGCISNRAKPKTCDKCGESYPSIMKFNAHRANCKRHKCPKCALRFIKVDELKKHTGTHLVRFHCDECETEPFHSQGQLANHKKVIHDIAIVCPHCAQTFKSGSYRDEHIKNKHTTETALKCACGATYVKKSQLVRHEEKCIVSPIGGGNAMKRKYAELMESDSDKAIVALKAFDIVREEAQKKINEEDTRLCCYTCGALYSNRKSLKVHIRTKHPQSNGSGIQTEETVSE